jgi:hypothetical protein
MKCNISTECGKGIHIQGSKVRLLKEWDGRNFNFRGLCIISLYS